MNLTWTVLWNDINWCNIHTSSFTCVSIHLWKQPILVKPVSHVLPQLQLRLLLSCCVCFQINKKELNNSEQIINKITLTMVYNAL